MNFTSEQITQVVDLIQDSGEIHADEIEKEMGFNPSRNQVMTRKLILAAIENGHIIISTTKKGYKIPSSKEEFDKYINSLNGRIDKNEHRRDCLLENWRATNG